MAQPPRTTLRLLAMDKFPNDWLEAAILFAAGVGVLGGVFALLYLAEINGAI